MNLNTPFFNPQDGRMRPTLEEGVWASINENEKGGSIDFSIAYNNDTTFDECGVSREYNFSISEVWNELIAKNKLYGYESSEEFYHLTNLKVYGELLKNK